MTAIFFREFKGYFNSMLGWVLTGVMLLFGGLGCRVEFLLELLRKLGEHHSLKLGIRRTRLPNRRVLLSALEHFNHLAVRNVDVGRAVIGTLHACSVLITRAGVVDNVQRLTDCGSDDVLGKIGLVFGFILSVLIWSCL